MSSSTDFSAGQLAAARAIAWHQDGKALLTIEGARNWVDHFGLVLFAPRAAQLGAPAPSFIEAVLGTANEAPTAAESAAARSLAARLVAEGSVLPLNLLGSAGDQPDFLASAKVFSYVFTMRGDKTWKQPPSTSDGAKVSPLAARVWEVLGEKGAMTASELATELGREVTEAAIARALNELWVHLRVIPQHQQDDAPALWERTSRRFAKAIKAGTNAGQPTAMSALLSLYLSQAVGATEEEVAGFLSPLTARSRVREVVHALIAGRQLDATVVDGKTLLNVSGTLPEFAPEPKPELAEGEEPAAEPIKKVGTGRIGKFAPGADAARKPRTDFKGKPAFGTRERTPGPRGARPGGPRPSRPAGARPDTERRPFKRSDDKPSFTKPWEEEKRERPESAEGEAPRKSSTDKPAYSPKEFGERKSFDRKPKPSFSGDRKPYGERTYGGSNSTPRKTFDKPAFGDRKPFTPREGGDDRPRRSFGDKPAYGGARSFGDRKPYTPREGGERKSFGDRKPYDPREGGERKSYGDKPAYAAARKPFGDRKPFTPREGGDDRPRRSFGDKPTYGAKNFADRKPYTPREGGERKPWGDKPAGGGFRKFDAPRPGGFSKPFGDRKPFTPREGGDDRPRRSFGDKPSFGARKPFTPREGGDDRPRRSFGDKPAFGSKPSFGARKPFGSKPSFGGKPSFGAKKPFGSKPSFGAKKPFGSKPGGFAKRPSTGAPYKRKPASEE